MTKKPLILGLSIVVLFVQAAFTYGMARSEFRPDPPPLHAAIPDVLSSWKKLEDGVLLPEVYEMLSPDDVLNRTYEAGIDHHQLNLFIAYYKTQLRAKNAHDPKVCLPGSGWNAYLSKVIALPGSPGDTANYYVVSKGGQKAVVLYWYQNHQRAVAEEQQFRLSRILNTITDNRTDMALVRIVSPVAGSALDAATAQVSQFAELVSPSVRKQFPPTPR